MPSPIRSAYVAPLALVFVALSARPAAAVEAQLTVSVTHLDDSPVTPASPIITREDAKLTIGYQITDLDGDGAHLEYDLCAPSDGGPGYGSSVRFDYDHRPACVTGSGNQGTRILFDHIAGSAGSTQAVIGVVTQTFRFAEDITPDGATLTIPIRLVSDGPAQTVVATATATATDRLHLQPESYIQILGVATGTDPATSTIPGYIVTYRVGLTQQFYVPGAGPVPHGELTGTLDSGAQIASITTYPNNPALFPDMGPAYPAFYATLYQNLSCTAQTDGAGHATGYAFSLDNILSFEATMDSCDLAVWYPRASSLQAQSTISASFSTGDTSQHSASIALGDGSIDGDLRHLSGQDAQWHDIGANWSTRTAHLPGYADNLDVYRVPRGLLGYYMDLTGALLVNPSTTLVLPPQFVATSISKVRDESSDSDITNFTVQMSADAGCGPTTTAWTTVSADDAALGTARCLLVSVPGLFQNGIDVRVLGRLDDATRTYLEAAPERYMFLHATAYYRMDNSNGVANDDRSEVGGPWAGDPNVKEVSDNMTVWNTSRAGIDDRFFMNFPGPIGSTGYEQVEVPFTQVGFTGDLTDLTFAQTLPLEVDLTGAPYPDSGYPLPLDVNGDTWTPDCTWSAQDRGQTPIVPAHWQCTFHGVFPAVRQDPFTAPGCTPANTYCLSGGYYATDSSGNPIFNAYHFNVPVIEVAGVQGQVVHQFVKAWSTGPLGEDGNPLPATSEANAAVAESVYQVSGAEQMNLSDVGSGTTLAVGGPITYDLKYSNVGSTGISNVFVYDLLGYDSSTGERLAGCEVPQFVSIANAGGQPAPIVQYTTDTPPLPNDSGNWTTTQPADLSTITGVRVQPVSAFSSTAGTFGPLDPQGHVQLTVRDTAGLGAQVCNNASITGQGFSPASANAGSATVIPIAANISLDPLTTCVPAVAGSNQLTITGHAALNNGANVDEVSLSMNTDTPVDVCNGDCGSDFSRLLPMQLGDNVITVTAFSHYAATTQSASETITCTSVGCGPCAAPQPSLSITFDPPAACTPPTGLELLVPISGTITAQNTTLQTVTLYVDAGPAITLCDGNCGSTFSVTAPFVFGTNTALIRAVDSSGQVTVDAELGLQCTSEGCGEACAPSACTPTFQIGTPTASEGLDPSGAVCAEGLIHLPYTIHNCPGSVAQYLFGAVAAMSGNGYVNGPAGVYAFPAAPQIQFFAVDAAADVSGEVLLDRTYFSLMDGQVHYLASPGNTVFELIPVVLTPAFSILPGLDLGNAASYLTQSDLADSCYQPGTCVDLVHAPTGQVMFEDLYPSNGDHDYNDQTVSYSYDFGLQDGAVTRIRATFNVLSVGAAIDNDLFVRIPGLHPSQIQSVSTYYSDGTSSSPQQQDFTSGGDQEVVFTVFASTRSDAFGGQSGFLNTDPSKPTSFGRAVMIDIVLNGPITSVDTGAAPYDIFLGRSADYGHQIHLPQFDGLATGANQSLFGTGNDGSTQSRHYVNTYGLPFALSVPDEIAWPKEKVAIDALYPDIVGFATSAGTANADWYLTNVHTDQAFTQGSDGNGAPTPLSVDSAPPLAICGH